MITLYELCKGVKSEFVYSVEFDAALMAYEINVERAGEPVYQMYLPIAAWDAIREYRDRHDLNHGMQRAVFAAYEPIPG